MIYEFFPPEMTNIQISTQVSTAYMHKQLQVSKDFTNYSKLVTQINNDMDPRTDQTTFILPCMEQLQGLQYKLI